MFEITTVKEEMSQAFNVLFTDKAKCSYKLLKSEENLFHGYLCCIAFMTHKNDVIISLSNFTRGSTQKFDNDYDVIFVCYTQFCRIKGCDGCGASNPPSYFSFVSQSRVIKFRTELMIHKISQKMYFGGHGDTVDVNMTSLSFSGHLLV